MFRHKLNELKLQSLVAQYEFLDSLHNRHRTWARDIRDPKIIELHLEIANLIQQTSEKYDELFKAYNQHNP